MDALESLRLQIAFGADEFLLAAAQDRRGQAPPKAPVVRAARGPSAVGPGLPAGPAEAARIADACEDLAALKTALAGFTGCALRDTATQLVFADGPEDAPLMLVGEAPGAEEDRAGRPFVGPAGQLLDKMMASIGQPRAGLRIVNTVPWRPPGNRNPTDAEVAVCLPFLRRHIALVRPKAVLLLGAVAAKALLPEPARSLGIRKLRGGWRTLEIEGVSPDLPCLPTYHPAYLLRVPAAKAEAWADLLTLRARLELGV